MNGYNKEKLDFWHKTLGIASSLIKIFVAFSAVVGAVYGGVFLLKEKSNKQDVRGEKSVNIVNIYNAHDGEMNFRDKEHNDHAAYVVTEGSGYPVRNAKPEENDGDLEVVKEELYIKQRTGTPLEANY